MAATLLFSSNATIISASSAHNRSFLGVVNVDNIRLYSKSYSSNRLRVVVSVTEGSADSSKSEETVPSWARPDSDEPPPWARDEATNNAPQQGFQIPFFVYLLASAITAITAIGSVFEYVNQRSVFGVLGSDSVFYAPLIGFFAFTGIPFSISSSITILVGHRLGVNSKS